MEKIMGFLFLALFLALLSTCSGDETATKYGVTNIVYTFDKADEAKLSSVAFDLDKPATVASVDIGGSFYLCESATPFTHWTCQLPNVPTAGVTAIGVVAIP